MAHADAWQVPRSWAGETAAILACGPSLTAEAVAEVRGRCRAIAINNAYELAPWADLIYFCDRRWYEWHHKNLDPFAGRLVTLENYDLKHPEMHHVHNYGRDGLHLEPPNGVMTGRNSGYQAINLAVLLGVRRILLVGYDMRKIDGISHFHGGHPVPTSDGIYKRTFLPMFEQLPALLEPLGVEVINCTPGSALEVFPRGTVAESL